MARVKRGRLWAEAELRNREQLARLGRELRSARGRVRRTQEQIAARAGVGRLVVGRIERGVGATASLDAWQRVALAVETPLVVKGDPLPPEQGLVWSDVQATRLFAWRRR